MTASTGRSITAIVHSNGGVSFVATACSADVLNKRLARYVLARCDDVLWPEAARRVRDLLAAGQLPEAIALYLERTGARWDRERLELVTVESEGYWFPHSERMDYAGL